MLKLFISIIRSLFKSVFHEIVSLENHILSNLKFSTMKKSGFVFSSLFFALLLIAVSYLSSAQTGLKYQLPPEEIVSIVDAEQTPSVSISPDHSFVALLNRPGLMTIEDLSREELRMGGLRIDPAVNGPSRRSYYTGISLMNIDGTGLKKVEDLPADPHIGRLSWSPDGSRFAFTNTTKSSIELWVCDAAGYKARKIANDLNMTISYYSWLPDSRSIVFLAVDENRGPRPKSSATPTGPIVQENMGKRGAARTFQDLLKNMDDEVIFEYFVTSRVMQWDGSGVKEIAAPAMYTNVSPSPDGNYFMVTELKKPFSYSVPYYYFSSTISIWNADGKTVKILTELPLKENLPRGFDVVFNEPRSFGWRADKPAAAYWVEPLDGGDPKNDVEYRAQVFILEAPFDEEPKAFIRTKMRYGGITWGHENFAIISEGLRKTRTRILSSFDPADPENTQKKMMEFQTDDRYGNPGRFNTRRNQYGRSVLLFADKGTSLILTGSGASPEGDRPFIRKYSIGTGETKELWRSKAPFYESVAAIIDIDKNKVITSRQSKKVPPNYFHRNLKSGKISAITDFKNPYMQLEGVTKELVKYKRDDGIDLTFDLYLPAGYNKEKDGPLPAILWAYPREFEDAGAAGQVSGSPYRFTRVSGNSILSYVTQGYAILNNASFPIIGEEEVKPNDEFVKQLVANAEAAINKAVEMGVADRDRMGVGGHSYGAFMTANLLTHSRLFAAGVARSGAYNRTLTPFGFQNERRTYWEAPEIYYTMSPFMHADKVKDPILLIHGAADNNSGTFPIQSERYYAALKGHGATVRLVFLPRESHGYAARESILHQHWEALQWFDTYVKNKK